MVIYRLTNKINGKVYVGQTVGDVKKRWTTHFAKSSGCIAIRAALRKYGKSNFKYEVVDTALLLEELNKKEEEWIEKENSLSPNGYNLTKGGNNREWSDDAKERAREAKRYEYEAIFCITNGKRYDNISLAARDLGIHQNAINYVAHGKTDTANKMEFEFVNLELKEKAKIRRTKRQERTKAARASGQEIICIETGRLYKTIKSAAIDLGIGRCDINAFLAGTLITAKGYTFNYVSEEKNSRRKIVRKSKELGKITAGINGGRATQKSVICIELNKQFDSISVASRELGICRSAITNMLAKRSRTAGGYTFVYASFDIT